MTEPVLVGRVGGVFGTRGWLKIQSYTRPVDNIVAYTPWQLGRGQTCARYEVAEHRRHHGGLIVRINDIADRDQAELLVRQEIYVAREQFEPTAPDEYYWAELIGLSVHNLADDCLGKVSGLIETAAHDVLQITGERERLIPYVSGVYVLAVDLTARRILVDWHRDD